MLPAALIYDTYDIPTASYTVPAKKQEKVIRDKDQKKVIRDKEQKKSRGRTVAGDGGSTKLR